MFYDTFFENRAVYEKTWKHIVKPGRSQMILWHISCCLPKATNTHTEWVTLTATPQQKWLPESPCCTLYVQYLSCLLLERRILPRQFLEAPRTWFEKWGKDEISLVCEHVCLCRHSLVVSGHGLCPKIATQVAYLCYCGPPGTEHQLEMYTHCILLGTWHTKMRQ